MKKDYGGQMRYLEIIDDIISLIYNKEFKKVNIELLQLTEGLISDFSQDKEVMAFLILKINKISKCIEVQDYIQLIDILEYELRKLFE